MASEKQKGLPPGLEQCDDCGAVMANLGGHDCDASENTSSTNPTRNEREQLIENDDRPLDSEVLISRTGRSYHETNANHNPVCRDNGEMRPKSREYAQGRGKCPCQPCLEKQKECLEEMREAAADACTACSPRVCHHCEGRSGGPRGPIEQRGHFDNHHLCRTCVTVLSEVDESE